MASRSPQGANGKQVVQQLGVATAKAAKVVQSLVESGRIRAEGECRGRKLSRHSRRQPQALLAPAWRAAGSFALTQMRARG